MSKPPDTAGKFKPEFSTKAPAQEKKWQQKWQLNQALSALLQFGNSSANIGKKLFYLHRQKVKALAGALSHVLRGRTSGRTSALKAEVAEGEASTAGSWLWSEIQCPVSSLLDMFVWQGLVLCDSSESSTGWPSSWTCEEYRGIERGLTKYTQGLHSFSGTKIPPVASSSSYTLEEWYFLPAVKIVADFDRFFSA